MRAALIEKYGGVDAIKVSDIDEPAPGAGEVLVGLKAAALNHLDIWVRMGRPGDSLSMPHILGSDGAGVIADVGDGVECYKKGDKVIINPALNCGVCEWCRRGEQSECASFGIIGLSRKGTFAERIALSVNNIALMPEHLSFEDAAALPLAHVTAWRMLMSRAQLQGGESVLIHGIGGGVAIAALQFASMIGAHIIVTSSSDDKLARARELGARDTINYTNNDVGDEVIKLTSGRGVDVIVDTVGAATWPINMKAARKGGRIVHVGVTTGAETTANISQIYARQLTIMGSSMGSHEDFRLMVNAVRNHELKPVIDTVFPLKDAQAATQRMEDGEQFGKIVLDITE